MEGSAAQRDDWERYTLVNLDAHLFPLPGWELFADVTNLFDRRYATFGVLGNNIYTANDEQFRTPAQGRAFMVGLRYALGHKPPGTDAD